MTMADNTIHTDAGENQAAESPSSPADKSSLPATVKKSMTFWPIMLALAFTGLLTALEATIVSTALPSIVADLHGANLYIWVANIYFLTMTGLQPFFGQVADIFGRRWPMLTATAAFTLGSGICGGASSIGMLLVGRAIQGIGAGGINVLIEVIVCDLVPLRERGQYLSMIFGLIAVGTALGPFFGGLLVQYSTWRWVFYLTLPVGGVSLLLLFVFLKVNYDHATQFLVRIRRIDWTGNIIFITSMVSLLIALSWAGTEYPWSSFRIILPLILGFAGLSAFLLFEFSKYCKEPIMPRHLFANRTSSTAFVLTFLHSICTICVVYFMPVYFQGVLAASPARSGVDLLPTILLLIPFAATAGVLLQKFGRYRPLHHVGFALLILSFGLFSHLDSQSSTAEWVIYQCIGAAGTGLTIPVLLPAVQAELTDSDTALATATWAFVRSFGMIWGVTIPAAVFNNKVTDIVTRIDDPALVGVLSAGTAYEHATKDFINSISDWGTRDQVIGVFVDALKLVWYVMIGFSSLGLLMVNLEQEIQLRQQLETEFGIKEKESANTEEQTTNGAG